MNRGKQVLLPKRLDEVAEDAGFDGPGNELFLTVRGQHDDRNRPLVQDPAGRFDPVQARHLHVEHGHVRLLGASELDRLLAVASLRADLEPRPFQQRPQVEPDDRLVLGDQDSHAAVTLLSPLRFTRARSAPIA